MAGAENQAITPDANETALQEFEAGVRRSIKQADAGLVKTFKTKEEFLNHLKNPLVDSFTNGVKDQSFLEDRYILTHLDSFY